MTLPAPEKCPHCGARCDPEQTACIACGEDVVDQNPAVVGQFRSFEGPTDAVPAVAFMPDGRRVVCAHATSLLGLGLRAMTPQGREPYAPSVLCVWDIQSETIVQRMPLSSTVWFYDVVCSPEGRVAYSAGQEDSIRVWDLAAGGELGRIKRHRFGSTIGALAVSPDGRALCSGGWDRSVRLWDVASYTQRFCDEGHAGKVVDLAFSGEGQRIVTASEDGMARLLDIAGREMRRFVAGSALNGVAFLPDGQHILTGGEDATLRIWSVASGAMVRELKGHTSAITCVASAPDGRRAVSGDKKGVMRLWDLTTGIECARADKHAGPTYRLDFSPDGQRVVSGGNDGWVEVWELPRA